MLVTRYGVLEVGKVVHTEVIIFSRSAWFERKQSGWE